LNRFWFVVAGLVPANPDYLALCPTIEVAGTSPATTRTCDVIQTLLRVL
jgi:hypothetical protein